MQEIMPKYRKNRHAIPGETIPFEVFARNISHDLLPPMAEMS
jgi:hypothetical protein